MRSTLFDGWAAVLAVLFATWTVIGISFEADDSASMLIGEAGAIVGSLISIALLGLFIYVLLLGLLRWLDRRDLAAATIDGVEARSVEQVTSLRIALRRWFVPTWLTVLAGWAVWLLLHFPGSVDSDTITQRLQWMGLQRQTDHHPWFDTMIFGWFWDLGATLGYDGWGLFLYLVVQQVFTAAGIALVLCYLSRLGLTAGARWTLATVAATFPVMASATAVMSKDALAGTFWLPFLVVFAEAVRTKGRVLMRPGIAVAAVLVCVPLVLTKRTNVYLVVLCAIVLVVICTWRRWVPIVAFVLGIVVLTGPVWQGVILPSMGIAKPTGTDVMTIPVQQTARIALEHGDSIPEEERLAIDRMLRWDGLADAYVPRRSDNVKGRWDDEASTSAKVDYLKVWAAQLVRYPGTALEATVANTFEYFAPVTPITYQDDLDLERYIEFWESRSFDTTTQDELRDMVDRLQPPEAFIAPRDAANDISIGLAEINPLASKAIVSSWLPLLTLAVALRRRNWFAAVATTPLFVNLAFLIASPVALPRYLVPAVYAGIFAVGLMLTQERWLPKGDMGNPATSKKSAH